MDDPVKGVRLLVNGTNDQIGLYQYSSKIRFYNDPSSFAIIRIAALLDLLTFSSYSATAAIFAVMSFAGMWLFFLTFYRQFPELHRIIAIATLFIPSVFFWGSGLLKDTVTLACLGAATFTAHIVFIKRKLNLLPVVGLLLSLYVLYVIKVYILLTFLPACIIWIFLSSLNNVQSPMLRMVLFPAVLASSLGLAYFAMLKAGEDNPKYSMEAISKTAQITAYDIRYWTGREAGSGYTLGDLDGTWQSLLRLAPQAVNVSLFRPYLWEVNNPLMLFAAIESTALLVFTVFAIYRARANLMKRLAQPTVLFCLIFSITFAFAVGVSTYNFGTLTRYKIPLIPFYCLGLTLLSFYEKRPKNRVEFAETEKP